MPMKVSSIAPQIEFASIAAPPSEPTKSFEGDGHGEEDQEEKQQKSASKSPWFTRASSMASTTTSRHQFSKESSGTANGTAASSSGVGSRTRQMMMGTIQYAQDVSRRLRAGCALGVGRKSTTAEALSPSPDSMEEPAGRASASASSTRVFTRQASPAAEAFGEIGSLHQSRWQRGTSAWSAFSGWGDHSEIDLQEVYWSSCAPAKVFWGVSGEAKASMDALNLEKSASAR